MNQEDTKQRSVQPNVTYHESVYSGCQSREGGIPLVGLAHTTGILHKYEIYMWVKAMSLRPQTLPAIPSFTLRELAQLGWKNNLRRSGMRIMYRFQLVIVIAAGLGVEPQSMAAHKCGAESKRARMQKKRSNWSHSVWIVWNLYVQLFLLEREVWTSTIELVCTLNGERSVNKYDWTSLHSLTQAVQFINYSNHFTSALKFFLLFFNRKRK